MEKIIHQIWIGKYRMPSREKKLALQIKEKHPDWQYMFWDDEAVSKLNMPPNVENAYRFWSNEHGKWSSPDYVAQSDILRFFLVYNFGGVYLDVDFEFRQVFDSLELEKYDSFICYHDTDAKVETFPNGIFGGTRGNKLFTTIVESIESNKHYSPHEFGRMVREYYGIHHQTSSHLGENGILKKFEEDNIFYMPYNDFHNKYFYHHALYSWSIENKLKFKSGNYD